MIPLRIAWEITKASDLVLLVGWDRLNPQISQCILGLFTELVSNMAKKKQEYSVIIYTFLQLIKEGSSTFWWAIRKSTMESCLINVVVDTSKERKNKGPSAKCKKSRKVLGTEQTYIEG